VSNRTIELRGVAVNNLQQVDLDLPHRELIVFCGVSGSGKTSMALDTLYAEGQRRYIESFSAYTRQFLEQLDKPAADRIDGIPPAVAVTHKNPSRSNRATVGTSTEVNDYLSVLFARIGDVFCYQCGQLVTRDSPESAAQSLAGLAPGSRLMLGFETDVPTDEPVNRWLSHLTELGYVRAVVTTPSAPPNNRHVGCVSDADIAWKTQQVESLDPKSRSETAPTMLFGQSTGQFSAASDQPACSVHTIEPSLAKQLAPGDTITVILDRLVSGDQSSERLRDSIESAFQASNGSAIVFAEAEANPAEASDQANTVRIDDRLWRRLPFSNTLRCDKCGIDYQEPEPQLFNFNRPLGACPECEGFGNIVVTDMDRVVPEPSKSIGDGAIAPWNAPAYSHERDELLALADDYNLPVDIPFAELTEDHRRLIIEGVKERNFGGLNGFFRWLERRKYKMHLRVFLSRWRKYVPCPACHGTRLRPEALAVRVGGKTFADVCSLEIRDAIKFLDELELPEWRQQIAKPLVKDVRSRLAYLQAVGLGYVALDRPLRTLSGGEAQRVALTSTLGSSLVDMLYVLDEPSVGLHSADVESLASAIKQLQTRGNTVVVVEHEEAIIRGADRIVEFGPGAGEDGGRIVFQGTPAQLENSKDSRTGDWLAGRRTLGSDKRRAATQGALKIRGARGNNLQNVTVEFPLGVLCLVTGVSGAGKSTLVDKTLFPAIARRVKKDEEATDVPQPLAYDDVLGLGQIDDVILIDQSPIGRSPRSNPATYLKAFDPIRALFAEQIDARTRNLTAGHFSFNVDGGRCDTCHGDGYLAIDMQFMADVYMKCPECHGQRYGRTVLEVKYRGLNIAEVLNMTAREAFTFFRGQRKIQTQLKFLLDVGLDYLRLGQPATTLSGGEAQRLKLAANLAVKRRGRTLFILDEPTTGLHFSDIVQLVDCFDALIEVGHSLIVVEHNLQLMKAADWIIDLGPGAANDGGRVVATGTPEEIANSKESVTGRVLKEALARDAALGEETQNEKPTPRRKRAKKE
jgi:excinuclease ABC subunit A